MKPKTIEKQIKSNEMMRASDSLLFLHLLLLPAILLSLFSVSNSQTLISHSTPSSVTPPDAELHHLKLHLARLESVLEETIGNLSKKTRYVEEREQQDEEISEKVHFLESTLSDMKGDSSNADKRLSTLEEEVRLLWAASRKNNFDIHVLQSRVKEAEDRLEVARSQVEKLADMVSEQWIQVQHLEQAIHTTKMRVVNARRQCDVTRCTFLKFMNSLYGNHLQKMVGVLKQLGEGIASNPRVLQALDQSKRVFSVTKIYHHELQNFIKQIMERNEVTAPLANGELVFFVASALVVFPVLSLLMWLSSLFG